MNSSEIILKFSHLLIRGLIEGLDPNLAIFDSYSTEMHHFVMHNFSIAWYNFC